jgi:hypothetical protein
MRSRLNDEQEEPLISPPNVLARSEIMDDFRRGTIGPMREATSSMRLTLEQTRETIGATRFALARVEELARMIDAALAARRATTETSTRGAGLLDAALVPIRPKLAFLDLP